MSKTNFVINNKLMIDADSLIFAEIAAQGAMGAAGIVNIFVMDSGKLKHYTFDSSKVSEIESYNNCDELFKYGSKNGLLIYQYAGYGNHAFKKNGAIFERDDDNFTLIYVGEKRHKIQVSNMGVYSHIIGAFAKSPVGINDIREIVENDSEKLTEEEKSFLKVYASESERFENGMPWFDITVTEYNDAISYLKFRRGENVEDYKADEYAPFGIEAIQKYRLKYIVEKIGWTRLHRFMKRFVSGAHKDLFKKLDEILDEKQKISEKFMKIRNGKSDNTEFSPSADGGIKHLFDYPAIINFEPETRKEIHEKIMDMGTADLRVNADNISYYLTNYFWHLFDWGFKDIEKVVWKIIDRCPDDDINGTGTDKMFWIASHIINTYWKRLSDKEEKMMQQKVNAHFSLRVGGMWPIVHFGEFKMNDEVGNFILEESIGYLVSVDKENLLPGLAEYLNTKEALKSQHPAVRHFAEEIQGKTS